jgi:hypothetical protein
VSNASRRVGQRTHADSRARSECFCVRSSPAPVRINAAVQRKRRQVVRLVRPRPPQDLDRRGLQRQFSCGANFINATNDSFGNGYFDGLSVVGGHEYAEAQTDPFPNSGWLDSRGAESGDKCAWSPLSTNITLGTNFFAVQPLWSNRANATKGGCVTSF